MTNATTPPNRAKMMKEMELSLGGAMIEVELTPDHYHLAIDLALDKYRQRAVNAVEESFVFLEVQPDVQIYTLPTEVQEVRSVYRTSLVGSLGTGGVDPFALSFAQNMYSAMMPSNLGLMGGAQTGSLALFDFSTQHMELIGRMFGRDVMFTWNPTTKKIMLQRKITNTEHIGLHCYNAKPDEVLLVDVYARPWLLAYAIAKAKFMLGEARSLYGSLAGPQGGITLNGDAMKSEATNDMTNLELELKDGVAQSMGYGIFIG